MFKVRVVYALRGRRFTKLAYATGSGEGKRTRLNGVILDPRLGNVSSHQSWRMAINSRVSNYLKRITRAFTESNEQKSEIVEIFLSVGVNAIEYYVRN